MRKKLFLVFLIVVSVFLPVGSTSALTTTELYNNAANNIFFYVKGDDACNPSTLAEYVATITGDQITWIGDYYSVLARGIIETRYPGVSIFAERGRNFSKTGGIESGIDVAKRLAENNALRKNVVFMLGVNGIGTYKAKYQIVSVDNTKGEHILEGSNVFMNRYLIETVGDYVKRRLGDIQGESNIYLKFATPVSLKYHGEFMQNFDIQTILNAIRRRLYILMCFEGIEEDNLYLKSDIIPEQISEHSIQSEVLRYSNRHRQGMKLKGITGELEIRKITGRNLELLIAGELIHIGNNTSFGFGKYEILLKE